MTDLIEEIRWVRFADEQPTPVSLCDVYTDKELLRIRDGRCEIVLFTTVEDIDECSGEWVDKDMWTLMSFGKWSDHEEPRPDDMWTRLPVGPR